MNAQWSKIIDNLRNMLDSGIFRVWVAPLRGDVDAEGVQVYAPNSFMAEWLKKHLLDDLRKAAAAALAISPQEVRLVVRQGAGTARKPESGAQILDRIVPAARVQESLPIRVAQPRQASAWRYTFDDFVTGPSNSFAVAAARDMCSQGQVRTLFVTSAAGLGKTHLAQAAGQAMAGAGSPLKIGYLTGEQFASRFVQSMKARQLEDFKQYLLGLDVLLLEDIHFLQRKKAMQELALGVIKNLQSKGARVIFTSSFSPRQLQDMDSQLISHFSSGILASMERPDLEMRRTILEHKAKSFQVALPDEVCDLLSRRLSSDVRQLESCLRSMVFKARLLNSGLTVDLALETLGQYAGAECSLDLEGIVRLVCESFGLTKVQLCSRSRRKEYVQGRNTVFYLARKHTDMSLEEIGCIFNRRHSTVMRSITQVEQEMARESSLGRQFARAVSLIERKCGLNAQA